MKYLVWPVAILATLSTVTACAGAADRLREDGVKVYKTLGSVQCSGAGFSLSDLKRELSNSGIEILSAACGVDGKLYAAMCGAPDGRITIFSIPKQQLQAASTLGFSPITDLPEATETSCR